MAWPRREDLAVERLGFGELPGLMALSHLKRLRDRHNLNLRAPPPAQARFSVTGVRRE